MTYSAPNIALESYRGGLSPGQVVRPAATAEGMDGLSLELREWKKAAAELNTDKALLLIHENLTRIEQYFKQMPVIFQKLFQDLQDDIIKQRIRYRSIENDFREKLSDYATYSTQRSAVIEGLFIILNQFEKEFEQFKKRFQEEIRACNTHLNAFPVIEFVVKLPMDQIPQDLLPSLLNKITALIPQEVGGVAQLVYTRTGSIIYSIRVPFEAARNISQAFYGGVFKAFSIEALVFIYSLSDSRMIHDVTGGIQAKETPSFTSPTPIKDLLRYAGWITLVWLLLGLMYFLVCNQ